MLFYSLMHGRTWQLKSKQYMPARHCGAEHGVPETQTISGPSQQKQRPSATRRPGNYLQTSRPSEKPQRLHALSAAVLDRPPSPVSPTKCAQLAENRRPVDSLYHRGCFYTLYRNSPLSSLRLPSLWAGAVPPPLHLPHSAC